jgi:hypothetical protein
MAVRTAMLSAIAEPARDPNLGLSKRSASAWPAIRIWNELPLV